MRILGIDPGLDITGYGVIDDISGKPVIIEAGVIRTSYGDGLLNRLGKIYSQVAELIDQAKPAVCVVEKLYSHYKHPMTSILMAHARGAVLLAAGHKNINVIDYPAKTAKRAVTGNGNASKVQVQRVINKIFNLSDDNRPLDVTDALALCLTHSYHSKKDTEMVRV